MRIIRNVSGAAEAEQRLVATMYNIERGALAVDDRGEPLAGPHAPYPTCEVKPATARGFPVVYHVRAAVGVVFYTAGAGFRLPLFVERARDGLARFGYQHLAAPAATSLSPCATVRRPPALQEATRVLGPQEPHGAPGDAAAGAGGALPARLMVFAPLLYGELPPHVSYGARFTWVFMPVTAVVGLKAVGGAAALNALVASALYDDAGLLALADGATVHGLGAADFALPRLPAPLLAAAPLLPGAVLVANTRRGAARTLEISLTPPLDGDVAPWHVPTVAWGSLRTYQGDTSSWKCFTCDNPLWGWVFVLVDPRVPAPACCVDGWDADWQRARPHLPPGESILAGRGAALCRYCARGACDSVGAHLGCQLVRCELARSHEEAFGGGKLRALLGVTEAAEKGFAPVPGMPGCFLVGAAGGEFVLAPAGRQWPCTASPLTSSLPVLVAPNFVHVH